MDLIVDPPRAVGPLSIGMPILDAERLLYAIDGAVLPARDSRRNPGFVHFESEMSIQVEPDGAGRLRSVEIYRPFWGVRVLYGDISIFETPADELIVTLGEQTPLEIEGDGLRVIAPELLIALSRDMLEVGTDGIEGRYFASMLMAKPGYYEAYERRMWPSGAEDRVALAAPTEGDEQDTLF